LQFEPSELQESTANPPDSCERVGRLMGFVKEVPGVEIKHVVPIMR
jgi:hypothetical protein